jgi:hypothetical protein
MAIWSGIVASRSANITAYLPWRRITKPVGSL